MSDKFRKIEKEYCITDDSVNVYKYRCLTAGLQLDEVKKNPIGYLMHNRDKGVVVRWDDFRVDGDKVFAKPVINLSHPEGQAIADQIESGFLNAASVGKIVVLEASNAPELKLKGQTRPTVTKWFPREISLVDIPGNYNALANLYDKDNHELNLSDLDNFNSIDIMSKTIDAVKILTALNLKDTAEESEVLGVIEDLIERAEKSDQYKSDLEAKETELKDLKADSVKKEVEDLIAKGKNDKKLTNELAEKLSNDYAANPTGLKDLIDTIPAQVSVVGAINDGEIVPENLIGKTWDDLYKSDELESIKTKYPDLYEKLRTEKYPNQKED